MKYTVRFRYVVRWAEEVEVEIPDNSTASEIHALIDKAESTVAYDPPLDEVDSDSWEWVGDVPQASPPKWVDVPTFEWGGHTWGCDGWAVVRSDVPPPTERQEHVDHVQPGAAVDVFQKFLAEAGGPPTHRFHERYRDLLRYADDRKHSGEGAVLYRDGQPIGVVVRNYEGTLDAWGNEVSP